MAPSIGPRRQARYPDLAVNVGYNGDLEISRPERVRLAAAAAIFLAAGAVYSIGLTAPYTHYHENVTACYTTWGRNYLRFGYGPSSFAPVKAAGLRPPAVPVPRQIYSHRPPTVSLLVSLSCRIFGATEGAVRVVGLVASLATLALFGLLSRRLLGAGWGLVAFALFAFIPNFAFYGVAVAHQTFGVLGGLAIFLATGWWQEKPTRSRTAALLGVVAVACWLDWPAFYAAGACGLLILFTAREKRWIGLLLPAAAVVSLGAFVFYLYRLDPVDLVPLKDFLSTGSGHSRSVALGAYLASHVREAIRWFTIPVLLLSAIGAGLLRPRTSFADAAILATALLGADSVLFSNLASGHLFLTVPLVPFAALAAARGLQALAGSRPGRAVAAAFALGFVAQSGLMMWRAHHDSNYTYPNEAARALASALQQTAAPEERTLARLSLDKHVLGYYADRPIALYSASERSIEWLDDVRVENGIDDAAILRMLDRPALGFAWFVTTTPSMAAERIESLRSSPDREGWCERYEFESEQRPSTLVEQLRRRYPEVRRDGFLFFDLRRPR
jgi:hypothetical protein